MTGVDEDIIMTYDFNYSAHAVSDNFFNYFNS